MANIGFIGARIQALFMRVHTKIVSSHSELLLLFTLLHIHSLKFHLYALYERFIRFHPFASNRQKILTFHLISNIILNFTVPLELYDLQMTKNLSQYQEHINLLETDQQLSLVLQFGTPYQQKLETLAHLSNSKPHSKLISFNHHTIVKKSFSLK